MLRRLADYHELVCYRRMGSLIGQKIPKRHILDEIHDKAASTPDDPDRYSVNWQHKGDAPRRDKASL